MRASGLGIMNVPVNHEYSVVDNPLVPQLLEELADVGANLGWIGIAELRLQFCDDLGEGALAVAALQDLPACALQLDCAFRKQDHARLLSVSPPQRQPAARRGWLESSGGGMLVSVPGSDARTDKRRFAVDVRKRKQVPPHRSAPVGMTKYSD